MPHADALANCKNCGNFYCQVCELWCPKCEAVGPRTPDTLYRHNKGQLHKEEKCTCYKRRNTDTGKKRFLGLFNTRTQSPKEIFNLIQERKNMNTFYQCSFCEKSYRSDEKRKEHEGVCEHNRKTEQERFNAKQRLNKKRQGKQS